MVVVLFYETDWTDWVSVLSWLGHYIRTGKKPKYTHVAVGYALSGYLIKYRFLTHHGIFVYSSNQSLNDYTYVQVSADGSRVKHNIQILANSMLQITWLDAIRFVTSREMINSCVTFTMNVIGMKPENITCDELYERLKEIEKDTSH